MPCDSLAWRATSASVVRAKPNLAIESTVASISCTRRASLMSLRAIPRSPRVLDAGLHLVEERHQLLALRRRNLIVEVRGRQHAVEIGESHLLHLLGIDQVEALAVGVAVAEVLDQRLAGARIQHGVEEVIGLVFGAFAVLAEGEAAHPGEDALLRLHVLH